MKPETYRWCVLFFVLIVILGFQVLIAGRQMFLLEMQLFEAKALMKCLEEEG